MEKSENKRDIYERLIRYPFHNIYRISDLDKSYWAYTDYFTKIGDELSSYIILKYSKFQIPIYIGISTDYDSLVEESWKEMLPLLPEKFYLHANKEIVEHLSFKYDVLENINSVRMGLNQPDFTGFQKGVYDIRSVSIDDVSQVQEFLKDNYPENWFDVSLLSTGKFKMITDDDECLAFGGIHTYSGEFKTAALGSISVHKKLRGQGIGSVLTAAICSDLLKTCDFIALNVKADNYQAIRCYEKVGFKKVIEYSEALLSIRG